MQATRRREGQGGQPGLSDKARQGLRRAVGYLGLQKRTAAIAYGALFIATIAQLAVPELIQNMINSVTDGVLAENILGMDNLIQRGIALTAVGKTAEELQIAQLNSETWLISGIALIIGFAIMRGIFSFIQTYTAEYMSQGVAFDMRNSIFSKIQRLSFSYYDNHQTGQLMIRATDDVERVRIFIAQGLILAIQAVILLVATLIILFLTNWQLTLVILPILPLAVVMFMIFGSVAQPLFIEVQKRLDRLNTVLQENVAGIKVVKAFTKEKYEQKKFDEATDRLFDQQLKVSRTFSFLFPVIFLIAQAGQALILYFAGQQIIGGSLDLGEYQKFVLYLVYVFLPLGQLGFIISLMSQAAASAERIFDILDTKSDVNDKPDARKLPDIDGTVRFEDVSFRYFSTGDDVLSGVSFEAKAGETIALLGATGSGKTTIINLIPRFYDVSEGAITIDGIDIRDVTQDSLRSQIGIVLQETNLFTGTIRDNIAFGRPEATMDEVESAAKAAAAHKFIMEFPDGYETAVGERGATLSGGQKQRVAIARALLLKPNILILDDSTSSVDFTTERQIQRALDTLMEGRTSFVIAQRISTVQNADKIIILDKGKVADIGTHTDLMEISPIYADIYNSQLVDDLDDSAETDAEEVIEQ